MPRCISIMLPETGGTSLFCHLTGKERGLFIVLYSMLLKIQRVKDTRVKRFYLCVRKRLRLGMKAWFFFGSGYFNQNLDGNFNVGYLCLRIKKHLRSGLGIVPVRRWAVIKWEAIPLSTTRGQSPFSKPTALLGISEAPNIASVYSNLTRGGNLKVNKIVQWDDPGVSQSRLLSHGKGLITSAHSRRLLSQTADLFGAVLK